MSAPLLSGCLIVKDEERQIGDCLASLRPLVDELVVADTGSTDRTAQIAREAGAKVIALEWREDFAAARNGCIDAALGEWILFVDADERIAPSSRQALHSLLRAGSDPAMTVEVRSPRGGGRVEVAHIARLFRRHPEHRYSGRIHESVLGSVAQRLGLETYLPPRSGLVIDHEGYLPERRHEKDKENRNRRLLLAQIEATPLDPGPRFLFARERTPQAGGDLLYTDQARESDAILQPAVERLLSQPLRGITEPALALAIRFAVAAGDSARAKTLSLSLRERCGWTARAAYAEGERAWSAGEIEHALAAFGRVRDAPDGSPALPAEAELRGAWSDARIAALTPQSDRSLPSSLEPAERMLITAARFWNDGSAAIGPLGELIKDQPHDPRGWFALALLLERLGKSGQSAAMFETARRAAPGWIADGSSRPVGLCRLFQPHQ